MAVVAAGCGSGTSAGSATNTKMVTKTDTVTITTTVTAPGGASSGSGATTSVPRCKTPALAIVVRAAPGGAAAGSTYYEIAFTNTGTAACTLTGFPGVSGHASGKQLGSPGRGDGEPLVTVTLAPGATAHSQLQVTDVENFPPSQCAPAKASDLLVYPPNDFAAKNVPFSFLACSKPGPVYLHVAPVKPGDGTG
jgi:hypothetical protein